MTILIPPNEAYVSESEKTYDSLSLSTSDESLENNTHDHPYSYIANANTNTMTKTNYNKYNKNPSDDCYECVNIPISRFINNICDIFHTWFMVSD